MLVVVVVGFASDGVVQEYFFFFLVNEDSIRTKKQDTNQRGIPQIKTWST